MQQASSGPPDAAFAECPELDWFACWSIGLHRSISADPRSPANAGPTYISPEPGGRTLLGFPVHRSVLFVLQQHLKQHLRATLRLSEIFFEVQNELRSTASPESPNQSSYSLRMSKHRPMRALLLQNQWSASNALLQLLPERHLQYLKCELRFASDAHAIQGYQM